MHARTFTAAARIWRTSAPHTWDIIHHETGAQKHAHVRMMHMLSMHARCAGPHSLTFRIADCPARATPTAARSRQRCWPLASACDGQGWSTSAHWSARGYANGTALPAACIHVGLQASKIAVTLRCQANVVELVIALTDATNEKSSQTVQQWRMALRCHARRTRYFPFPMSVPTVPNHEEVASRSRKQQMP